MNIESKEVSLSLQLTNPSQRATTTIVIVCRQSWKYRLKQIHKYRNDGRNSRANPKVEYTNRAIKIYFVFQCLPLGLHCAIQRAEILVVELLVFLLAEIHAMISSCYRKCWNFISYKKEPMLARRRAKNSEVVNYF